MSATAMAVAFAGGTVSLLSPCVLPVVPAYLSITAGLGSTAAVLRGGLMFVAGFSAVFVALGLSATALGSLLLRNHVPVTRVSGVLVVLMALALLAGTLPLPWLLGRELRFHPETSRFGVWAAPVAGAAFAFGWTPCIGPVLASVLAVAANQARLGQGAALLAMYAAGLGLPFLVIGLTFHRSLIAIRFLRRHSMLVTRASATVLLAYGGLLVFDRLSWTSQQLQQAASALGMSWLVGLG
jgi:cytochrome c-type biogenesis protein